MIMIILMTNVLYSILLNNHCHDYKLRLINKLRGEEIERLRRNKRGKGRGRGRREERRERERERERGRREMERRGGGHRINLTTLL